MARPANSPPQPNPPPKAVLLDVGGVLFLPEHARMLGALVRAGFTPDDAVLDRAHYTGAAQFSVTTEFEEWPGFWKHYLDAYITTCGVPDELRDDAHLHLDSEFAAAAAWNRIAPGSIDGLRALADTGVRLGIVSNADGTIEQMLRDADVAQIGPGPGVEMECIIDSGVVGVAKPDPRVFSFALDAMGVEPTDAWYVGDMPAFDIVGARAAGLRPFVMDPYQLHLDADYERVGSLHDLAALVRG
jgi:putative hydrolase of the HAD superfamily